MKILNKILIHVFSMLMISMQLIMFPHDAAAQKKERTRLKVYYEELPNTDRKIFIELTQGSGKDIRGVEGVDIDLTMVDLEEEVELTTLQTDSEGQIELFVQSDYSFPKDLEGYSVINAVFEGNDSLRSADRSVKFKNLYVDTSFDVEDTLKTLTIETYELDSTGVKMPAAEVDINIGVQRLYSILYLEKVETDEEGLVEFEFPNDIPGDSIGTINVVLFIEDHDDYGTIRKRAEVDWGIPVDYTDHPIGRSLFGDEAPLWMIISVFIILTGAWYHFGVAIFKLIRMKRLSLNRSGYD